MESSESKRKDNLCQKHRLFINQIRFIIFSHATKIGIFYLMAKRAVISYLNLMTRYCSVAAVPMLTLLCA